MEVEEKHQGRPIPPDKPLPAECCESGCDVCVFEAYAEALAEYERALARWEQMHGSDRTPQPLT